ncbi:hypothetical protein [Microbacterium sp. GXF7504]
MDRTATHRTHGVLRAVLLGFGAAAVWFLLSLLAPASSASADDGDRSPDGGVLGLVQGVVDGVVGTVDRTVSTVGEAVPVLQPVTPVVSATLEVVQGTVGATTGTVSQVVDAVPVSAVTDPVLGLVDGVVDEVPIVNEVVDATGLVPAVSDTTHALDETVSAVVSGPSAVSPGAADPAQPAAPGVHRPQPDAGADAAPSPAVPGHDVDTAPESTIDPASRAVHDIAFRSAPTPAPATAAFGSLADEAVQPTPASPGAPSSPLVPGADGAPGGAMASGSGAWGPHAAAVVGVTAHVPHDGRLTARAGDDSVPSAPVLGTDCSPD